MSGQNNFMRDDREFAFTSETWFVPRLITTEDEGSVVAKCDVDGNVLGVYLPTILLRQFGGDLFL